jgi:hypothetical protein
MFKDSRGFIDVDQTRTGFVIINLGKPREIYGNSISANLESISYSKI